MEVCSLVPGVAHGPGTQLFGSENPVSFVWKSAEDGIVEHGVLAEHILQCLQRKRECEKEGNSVKDHTSIEGQVDSLG